MKKLALVLCSLTALALTGCYGDSTPENTVKSAAYWLKNGNERKFNQLLADKALAKYGSPEAYKKLQAKFNVKPEPKFLGAQSLKQWATGTTQYATWLANVGTADGKLKMSLAIACRSDYEWEQYEVCNDNGNGHHHEDNCHWESRRVRRNHCKITDTK